jgi:hypothetical protein
MDARKKLKNDSRRDRPAAAAMTDEIDGYRVHPGLALIPLMKEGEMQGLVASIKANGLRDPIVLDGEVLIDGRCRLLACRSAGVEPRFKQLPAGADPVDYIVSVNLMRVHRSPGQRAMQAVLIARDMGDPEWCVAGIHPDLVQQCRTIIAAYPTAVPLIVSGAYTVDGIYQKIMQDRRVSEWRQLTWARLQAEAPSIADLVSSEQLTLQEAADLHRRRQSQQAE